MTFILFISILQQWFLVFLVIFFISCKSASIVGCYMLKRWPYSLLPLWKAAQLSWFYIRCLEKYFRKTLCSQKKKGKKSISRKFWCIRVILVLHHPPLPWKFEKTIMGLFLKDTTILYFKKTYDKPLLRNFIISW